MQSEQQNGTVGSSSNGNTADTRVTAVVILDKVQLQEYQEKVFSVISEKSGKLNFTDLLELMGGATYKQSLYKVLMNLAKQGRITRIRGLGKKRIEFYYYDTKKLKKPAPSAAVSFVHT